MSENTKRLNLGCGKRYRDGYINVDWSPETKADILCDLNHLPYQWPDNSFDEVYASHILEHLDKPVAVMKEIHRILRPGGLCHLRVPHFSRGFSHVEHEHGFDILFPNYFKKTFTKFGYFGFEFELEKMELHWMAFFHLLPSLGYRSYTIFFLRGINALISFVANLSPRLCSRVWCYWVGGLEEIEFKLRAVKD